MCHPVVCDNILGSNPVWAKSTFDFNSGGALEDHITLVLVKKGVIDCENDTQCADDRACMDSLIEPGRMLCEKPCER